MGQSTATLLLATLAALVPLSAQAQAAQTSNVLPTTGDRPAIAVGRTHDCVDYYPAVSQRLNQSGNVLIRYDVEADGRLTHIAVQKSSGFPQLDLAAQTCVSQRWRDVPAMRGGVAVASRGHQAIIQFVLMQTPPATAPATTPLGSFPLPHGASAPASTAPDSDTGTHDAETFLVWTLGPLAILAWLVFWARLWVFRRRDCPSCGAVNRSIVPFGEAGYCSSCGTKFAADP